RVEAIDRLGRRGHRRVVAEGDVRLGQVVVDGLGQAEDVHAVLHQVEGHLVRAVAAQAHETVQAEAAGGFDGARGEAPGLAVAQGDLGGVFGGGGGGGGGGGQGGGDVVLVQDARVVLDEAAKALLDADDLDVKVAQGRLGHAADGGVQPRAIAAAGEDADAP